MITVLAIAVVLGLALALYGLAGVRRLIIELAQANATIETLTADRDRLLRELEDVLGPCCSGCGHRVDRDTCHCGTPLRDHGVYDGHAPVPMGCACLRGDTEQDWKRIAEARHRIVRQLWRERDSARRWLATAVRIARRLRNERNALAAERLANRNASATELEPAGRRYLDTTHRRSST